MGIFSELKKLFWTTSAVAKNAADKGIDRAREVGEDLVEKGADIGGDILDKSIEVGSKLKDRAEDIGEDIFEKSVEVGSKLKDRAEDLGEDLLEKTSGVRAQMQDKIETLGDEVANKTGGLRDAILHSAEGTMAAVNKSETLQKVAAKTESIGERVLSKGEELLNKGEDAVEALGSKILGKDHENVEKLKGFTEDLGGKVMDAKEKIVDRAKDVLEDVDDKIDETLAKAKKEEAQEAANPTPPLDEILDKNQGSLLGDDKDDFFAKAAAYAEGDYHGAQEGMITIQESTEEIIKVPSKAAGFTDHDGDGNEVIDDAILVAEQEVSDPSSPVANIVETTEAVGDATTTGAISSLDDNVASAGQDLIDDIKEAAGEEE